MKKYHNHENSGHEALCPACNRYVGPVTECPYCGCDTPHSTTWKLFRLLCLLLAVIGLILLHVSATHKPPAVVTISDITPMMNRSHVRILGTVEKEPYIGTHHGRTDYCSFTINDGTGSLRVSIYGEEAEDLEKLALPERGWKVEATGDLKINGKKKRMVVRRAGDIGMLSSGKVPES